ncbi:MAG: acetyl-CoA carboxylase biotin carboxylase subunit [Bryobacterales bacterium]|nr:acetyl-CoA carboxylase biotin carboxylase subunit [Bryobacterales bacterium]
MFERVLIANRGEIALRVIAACRDLGVKTVAVYSTADRDSLHVRYADEAVCIGPPPSSQSYLSVPAIISAAEIANVDAIHPGYGFLAEDPHFAEICGACGIQFIGPSPEAIRLMGDKAQARKAVREAGIPVLPGSQEPLQSPAAARGCAEEIGFPVILKASMGGGGRGMRIVRAADELGAAFQQACAEAGAAFGVGDVYLEKFVERPRHIEFQVLGDNYGKAVSLGERECSIQRRHQKLLEEAPANGFGAARREEMAAVLCKALAAIGYSNAGTVEFLMDEEGELHFIELNARIQVEHPVTEAVTGVDLVKSQILLAAGEPLDAVLSQPVSISGHAIECRVNAEDPRTFMPSAGKIKEFSAPGGIGVRVDTAAYSGWMVQPYYDSLVAKITAHGATRVEAIQRMRRALSMCRLDGVKSSIPLHRRILEASEFTAGRYDTRFIEEMDS